MIIKKRKFTNEEINLIESLANKSRLSFEVVSLLYQKGVKTLDQINDFINPSKSQFHNPFLLSGMTKAVERIVKAKENNEKVVIFGDYDADGICATSLLFKCLKIFGVQTTAIVPERETGYGLNENIVESIIEIEYPDLIITVDCGISNYKVIEHIQDLGVDVIVTDHHEIPEILPNTITINCKLENQEYPFSGLCGAGVAYKLAYALIGNKADDYLDLVALATIADSMLLVNENRAIVAEGLKLIKNGRCQKAIKALLDNYQGKEISASNLIYSIVPKINAAGRMGDASSALRLFISQDDGEINYLANQLNEYNAERQELCNVLYKQAKEKIASQGAPNKAIVIYNENWMQGLLGIISARIAEEYNLPCIMLSKNGETYHGSARSIEGINIYEGLRYAKEYLEEFGGHSQAAGVKIKKENICLFTQKLKEYVSKNITKQTFVKKTLVEDINIEKLNLRFVKELSLLEPFGIGNEKPLFTISSKDVYACRIKTSSHVRLSIDRYDLVYFNGEKDLNLLNSSGEKHIVFECGISNFNNVEHVSYIVKHVEEEFQLNQKLHINCLLKVCEDILSNQISGDYIECNQDVLSQVDPFGYGTLLCVTNPNNLKYYQLDEYVVTASNLLQMNGKTVVKVGGITDEEAILYSKIIFLDNPFITPKIRGVTNVVNVKIPSYMPCLNRDILIDIYKQLVKIVNLNEAKYENKIYFLVQGDYTLEQIVFSIESLKELGILKRRGLDYYVDNSVKKDLLSSLIFNKFSS